jgi:hypothetical protein
MKITMFENSSTVRDGALHIRSQVQTLVALFLTSAVTACGSDGGSTPAASAPASSPAPASVVRNNAVPPNANTTNPNAPFYVDTSGLTFTSAASPPVRDPKNPKYPASTELPDGQLPGKTDVGNFIIGPTHTAAIETVANLAVPQGQIYKFTMTSAGSVIYNPGIVRDEASQNAAVYTAPTVAGDPSSLIISTSHPGTWSRSVSVYVPKQYAAGTSAPFIVTGDGGALDSYLFATLDNLIAQGRVPPMVAIAVGNGGSDAPGSERGREYDTVSGVYGDFVENEVLPMVQSVAGVQLTTDPSGRATMGLSSSGAAAFSMAWFRPDRYGRVISYSPTMTNQQWPHNPALPGGAWQFHSTWGGLTPTSDPSLSAGTPLITTNDRKPIRYWFETGDQDLFYTIVSMPDGMHDWVLANENMARALASKGYQYQFVFSRNAGHVDLPTVQQTLPAALEWLWADFKR